MTNHSAIGSGLIAPLSCFHWEGDSVEICPGVIVTTMESPPPPGEKEWRRQLDARAEQELRESSHWLSIADPPSHFSHGELVNLFLHALWLAVPTEAHVRHRWGDNPTVMLSRMASIKPWNETQISDAQLFEAGRYLDAFLAIPRQTRLNNALHLTVQGSFNSAWQPTFITWMAALEGLLICCEEVRDNAGHLSETYAVLTTEDAPARRQAKKVIRPLYNIRSAIVHGRVPVANEVGKNLENLRDLQVALRTTWKSILTLPGAVDAFQGTDADRLRYVSARKFPRPESES